MGKITETAKVGGGRGGKRPYRYPWDEWFEQGEFTVHRGTDFGCAAGVMSQTIRVQAWKRGVGVTIVDVGNRGQVLAVTVRRVRKVKRASRAQAGAA